MKRSERIRYSKKRHHTLFNALKNRLESMENINIDRIAFIYKMMNCTQKSLNIHTNKEFKMDNYKDINLFNLISLLPCYKDRINLEERRFTIQMSRTFCCPITKKILDMNKSLFVKYKGQKVLISNEALNKMQQVKDIKFLLGLIEFN